MSRFGRRRALLAGAGVVATALAGCSGGGDDGPADRGPIEIRKLAFAADRPAGYDEYDPQPDATYGRGDVVWLYVDYEGLSGAPEDGSAGAGGDDADGDGADGVDGEDGTDGQEGGGDQNEGAPNSVEIDLLQAVTVVDPNGESVVEDETTFQEELVASQLERYFTGTEILLSGDVAAGEYETTVTVTDRVSESADEATGTFRIER